MAIGKLSQTNTSQLLDDVSVLGILARTEEVANEGGEVEVEVEAEAEATGKIKSGFGFHLSLP